MFNPHLITPDGRHTCDSFYPGECSQQLATERRIAFTSSDMETRRMITFWFCPRCAALWDGPSFPGDDGDELTEGATPF